MTVLKKAAIVIFRNKDKVIQKNLEVKHFITAFFERELEFMNSKLKDDMTDKLFEAILLLDNVEECYNFFEDICTVAEIKALAQRLEVASMLREGKTYTDISEVTGASTATISRINRALNYGADGYKTILDRLEDKKDS